MTDDTKSGDSFAALFEQESRNKKRAPSLRIGDRVEASVVQITREAVFLDLDAKRQAWIDPTELHDPMGQVSVRVGERIVAHIVEIDGRSGAIKVGRTLPRGGNLAALELAHEQGIAVEGKVLSINKGGAEVEVDGTRTFCPVSQLDNRYVADPASFVGRTLHFRVTEIRDGGRRVVLSRRVHLEAEAREASARTLRALSVGTTVKGTVASVRDFGVFVDLGGVEGLVPASELSHDVRVKPADVLKVGELIEVSVKEIRSGEGQAKITLSLKALSPDPWDALDVVAPRGRALAATVARLVDFGAFVRLAAGIEGLLHVSELSGKVLEVGQNVLVVVKSADAASRKIALALAPDGATAGAEAVLQAPVQGAIVKAVVDRVEAYGVFVQIEGTQGRIGRGLIPNADLGTPRGADVRKHFAEGAKVTAKVIETGEGRLRLSIRAVRDDEERAAYEGYQHTTRGGTTQSGKATLGDLMKLKLKK